MLKIIKEFLPDFIQVWFCVVGKVLAFKGGALLTLSAGLSTGIIFYFNQLVVGTETKQLILPIAVHIAGSFFFFLFVIGDLGTGLWAAKIINLRRKMPQKNYVRPEKLYKTFWKLLGIMLLNTMFATLCIFTELIDGDYSYLFTLWMLVTSWLMASGFEFHSIGDNILKATGEKPPMFAFFEKLLNAVQRKAISRIEREIDPNPTQPQEELQEELQEEQEQKDDNINIEN